MIPASRIANSMRASLDAESSTYYRDDRDIIPAINNSVRYIVNLISSRFGTSKMSEEFFKDLLKLTIYQTNAYSRILLDDLWTIVSVLPKPEVKPARTIIQTSDLTSLKRDDLAFYSALSAAEKLTSEEYYEAQNSPFHSGGNSQYQNELRRHSYISYVDYSSNIYTQAKEIEISPKLPKELVAVKYIKLPTVIVTISDNVEFPEIAFQSVLSVALKYISYKQGDQTSIFALTDKESTEVLTSILQ